MIQVQSAGFTGWLAPLWRVAACLLLTILGFFKVEFFDVENTVEVLVFSWSLTITHPHVGAIARCILSKGSFDNSLDTLRPLDPSVRGV